MRRPVNPLLLAGLLAMSACATGPSLTTACEDLAATPSPAGARLQLRGDQVVAVAVPIEPIELTTAARTTFEAIAPQGETLFLGRERGARGAGFRIEKRYRAEDGSTHTRSALVDEAGAVLERSHSVAVPDVPQPVLAVALRSGRFVDDARIVSGPAGEEHWALEVHDGRGERFVVVVDLDGNPLARWRRAEARVDAAAAIR